MVGLVVVALLVAVGLIQYVKYDNLRIIKRHLARFTPVPELGTFKETLPFAHATARLDHAVLLLHGFSAGTSEFKHLAPELRRAEIPHYAPEITGFGIGDVHLLASVRPEDWLRDAMNAYDTLAAFAKQVSIVGHSNGGALAAYVAQHRPVKHLVLSGPNILPVPADQVYKTLFKTPVLGPVFMALRPMPLKPTRAGRVTNTDTVDPEAARELFHFPAVPIESVKALWDVQDRVDLTRARFETLTLVYGAQDGSVDIGVLRRLLDDRRIPYVPHAFANSGHNVLEDHDKAAAVRVIVERLLR